MATTYTPNYNLAQPEVGGEVDTWGGLLNTDLLTIDTTMKAISDVANGAVPKTGGTMTNTLTLAGATPQLLIAPSAAGAATAYLRTTAAGAARSLFGQTGTSTRWELSMGSSAAESGSNAGSDFGLHRYSDAGAYIDTPISIARSSGVVNLQNNLARPNGFWPNGRVAVIAGATSTGPFPTGKATLLDMNSASGRGQLAAYDYTAVAYVPLDYNASVHNFATGYVNIQSPAIANNQYKVVLTNGGICTTGSSASFVLTSRADASKEWHAYSDGDNYKLFSSQAGTDRFTLTPAGVASAIDFQSTSDARLKSDFEAITDPMERLDWIKPQLYTKEGRREAGVIAQEVRAVLATAVSEGDDGYLRVSHGQLQALVIAAVQELNKRLKAVEEAL